MKWLDDFRATYFANATAARDYRVQLRGNRSVLLFGLYLAVLIGVAFVVYTQRATYATGSIVEAQQTLQMFYMTIMMLLGGMIALIAPALSATTICQERIRHSFDLVFSAPVSPKYYLVGKVISSYRYTWMLLALSLPVTAASVVLGGAAWSDVLIAYLLLSVQALLFTSIALLLSTLAPRPVSAVMWTYAAMLIYLLVGSSVIGISMFSGRMSREQPFIVALSPFGVTQATDTYTMVYGYEVPNWIIAGGVILLLVRLILLAAGSLLGSYGSREGLLLRIHALAYTFAAAIYAGYSISTTGTNAMQYVGEFVSWPTMILCIMLPFMTCYGYDNERLHWPNGLFKLRRMLDGTPAGALPFVLAFLGVGFIGMCLGVYWNSGKLPDLTLIPYVIFTVGFWSFFWGVGRFASLTGNIKNARTLQFAVFLLVAILPLPFITALVSGSYDGSQSPLWYLWVLFPLTKSEPEVLPILAGSGIVMLILGIAIAARSERLFAHRIRKDLVEDERLYARA